MLKFLTSRASGSLALDDGGYRSVKKVLGGSLNLKVCGLTGVGCGLSTVGCGPLPEKSAVSCGLKTGVVRCGLNMEPGIEGCGLDLKERCLGTGGTELGGDRR